MVKTRGQQAAEANRAQQAGQNNPPAPPPPQQPAPQQQPQPAPQAQKPAPKKPKATTRKSGTKKATKPQKPKAPTRKGPAARGRDQEAYDPANEEGANDENEEAPAPAPKCGSKRPAPAANAEPSPKVARTQAAGRSGRKTAEAQPTRPSGEGSAVVENQGPSKAKGKGKVKGKGKGKKQGQEKDDEEADEPVPANGVLRNLDWSGHHAGDTADKFNADRKAQNIVWSSKPPEYDGVVWKGAAMLGAGSYGAAFAFYCEDASGLVSDRIALKDTVVPRQNWGDWTKWWGDAKNPNVREHMEIKLMRDFQTRAKEGRCVVLRGSGVFDHIFTYRILMNYCPAGSMHDAMPAVEEVHIMKRKGVDVKIGPPDIINDGYDIPEPLLWKWFEDLAKACRLMDEEQDLSNDPKDPRPGLSTIVHRDIKPSNVFLDLPSGVDGDWPSYPIATMGDFGSAIYTNADDIHNPMVYNYWQGTEGFRPLELATVSDATTKRYTNFGKLGSATNIWTIGQSILVMMNREAEPKTNPYDPALMVPTPNANAQHIYSNELRDLVSACVRYRPEERITTQDVLDAISQHTAGDLAGEGDQDLGGGMRAGQPTSEALETPYVYLFPKREHYRLGMTFEDGERLRVEETRRDEAAEADRLEGVNQLRVVRRNDALAANAAEAKANRAAAKAAKGK